MTQEVDKVYVKGFLQPVCRHLAFLRVIGWSGLKDSPMYHRVERSVDFQNPLTVNSANYLFHYITKLKQTTKYRALPVYFFNL